MRISSAWGAAYRTIPQPAQPTPVGPGLPPSLILQADSTAVAKIDPRLQAPPITSDGKVYNHLNPAAIAEVLLLCHFTTSSRSSRPDDHDRRSEP
jgi:hypothetical protein